MNKYAIKFYNYVDTINGYKCLSEYKGSDKKVLMYHEKCGNEYWQTPSKFMNKKRRCHYCSKSRPLTTEVLQKRLNNKFGNKFTLLEEYVNSTTKIKVRNNNCGHVYKIKQQDLLSGKDCYECFGSKKYTQEEFEHVFNSRKLKGYSLRGIYKGYHKKVDIVHDKCGTTFSIVPSRYFKQYKKCPKCYTKSIGETLIEKELDDMDIRYIREHRFNDCKYKNTLPFDFYLPDYNIAIEYQGQQHYKEVAEFGGNGRLKYTQNNDKIKKEYCINNNIKLIEIPYWDRDNIKEILVEKVC